MTIHDPLTQHELRTWLFEPCDDCLYVKQFIELADWADDYGRGTLTRLYDYCFEKNYDAFCDVIRTRYM